MSKFKRNAGLSGLNITRKVGQQVVVNHGEIRIEVVDIKGQYVRLAFKAHKEIDIKRAEIIDAIESGQSAQKKP